MSLFLTKNGVRQKQSEVRTKFDEAISIAGAIGGEVNWASGVQFCSCSIVNLDSILTVTGFCCKLVLQIIIIDGAYV